MGISQLIMSHCLTRQEAENGLDRRAKKGEGILTATYQVDMSWVNGYRGTVKGSRE